MARKIFRMFRIVGARDRIDPIDQCFQTQTVPRGGVCGGPGTVGSRIHIVIGGPDRDPERHGGYRDARVIDLIVAHEPWKNGQPCGIADVQPSGRRSFVFRSKKAPEARIHWPWLLL